MAIYIKTKQEIKIMRQGGKILAEIVQKLAEAVKPGISTKDLDILSEALFKQYKVISASKGYNGFPASICTGIDDMAVHGIPSPRLILQEGQICSIDVGMIYDDYFVDHAVTVPVGEVDPEAKRLLETTKLALKAGISQAVAGNTVGDIGNAIESTADLAGFSVIRIMTGHGIGLYYHEDPSIPCFGEKGKGSRLREGMTIAIEAMINEGGPDLIFEDDGWTTRTRDGKRSNIFEHTVVVGKRNAEILTIK